MTTTQDQEQATQGSYVDFIGSIKDLMASIAEGFNQLSQAQKGENFVEVMRYTVYITAALNECVKIIETNKAKVPAPMIEISAQCRQLADIFDCALAALRSDMADTMTERYTEIASNFEKFQDMLQEKQTQIDNEIQSPPASA